MAKIDAWHSQPVEDGAGKLNANTTRGLDTEELLDRLARYGANKRKEHAGDGPFKRFVLQFHQPLVYILLAAVAVTLALGEWVHTAVIFAVVVANAIIGFVQETNALEAISALYGSLLTSVTVIRKGVRQAVSAEDLVPGDFVVLQAGDKVRADMRLVKVRDLQNDESALTGESVPSEKYTSTLAHECVLMALTMPPRYGALISVSRWR